MTIMVSEGRVLTVAVIVDGEPVTAGLATHEDLWNAGFAATALIDQQAPVGTEMLMLLERRLSIFRNSMAPSPVGRELSLAITHIEDARLRLGEAIRMLNTRTAPAAPVEENQVG